MDKYEDALKAIKTMEFKVAVAEVIVSIADRAAESALSFIDRRRTLQILRDAAAAEAESIQAQLDEYTWRLKHEEF